MVCLPISPRRLNQEVRILARNLILCRRFAIFSTGALIGSGAGAVVSEIVPRTPPETGARLCFAPTVKAKVEQKKIVAATAVERDKKLQNRKHRKVNQKRRLRKLRQDQLLYHAVKEPKQ